MEETNGTTETTVTHEGPHGEGCPCGTGPLSMAFEQALETVYPGGPTNDETVIDVLQASAETAFHVTRIMAIATLPANLPEGEQIKEMGVKMPE